LKFTLEQAAEVAKTLGIDFSQKGYSLEEFTRGMNVELEHGSTDPFTNVTNDDPVITGKITLAHLNELPAYYDAKIGLEAWEQLVEHLPPAAPRNGIQIN